MMKTTLRGAAFIICYFSLLIGLLWLCSFLPAYSEIRSVAEIVAMIFANLLMFGMFLIYCRRTRKRRIAAEADRWFESRKRQHDFLTNRWQRKRNRFLLWLPSLTVAVASLFVPETIGLALHGIRGRPVELGGHLIQIPGTWIEWSIGDEYLGAMTAPGLGRLGFGRYWKREVPLSDMVFYPVRNPELNLAENVRLDGETVLAKRSFPLGKETLTCWDLIHNNPFVGPRPTDPAIADISCTTESDHFYAHFSGWRKDADTFYEVIEKITPIQ